MMIAAICACIFLATSFAAMAFVLESQSKTMSDRFTTVARNVIKDDDLPETLKASLRERIIQPLIERLQETVERLTPKVAAKAAALRIERAGRPWGITPATWSLVRIIAAAGGVLGGLALMKIVPLDRNLAMGVGGFVAVVGVIGPGFVLDGKIKKRQIAVRGELPDIIDLLVVSVEAGLGLDAAVQEVISRRDGPLLDELGRVLTEVRMGKTRRTAWQEFGERINILEVKVFVSAIVQAEELGSSIASVMRGQADALRVRRSLTVREVAAVLPVKMLFPLIFFIFPGVFVVILGPGMITLVDTFRAIGF